MSLKPKKQVLRLKGDFTKKETLDGDSNLTTRR